MTKTDFDKYLVRMIDDYKKEDLENYRKIWYKINLAVCCDP